VLVAGHRAMKLVVMNEKTIASVRGKAVLKICQMPVDPDN
jgi:hypothetical protein